MVNTERRHPLHALLTSRGFSHVAVQRLVSIGNWQELAPGQLLLGCGERIGSLAVVEQGEAAVFSRLGSGEECFLMSLREGDIVGWELLTSEDKSLFLVRARWHTRLWKIPAAAFEALLADAPQVAALLTRAALDTMQRLRTAGTDASVPGSPNPSFPDDSGH